MHQPAGISKVAAGARRWRRAVLLPSPSAAWMRLVKEMDLS